MFEFKTSLTCALRLHMPEASFCDGLKKTVCALSQLCGPPSPYAPQKKVDIEISARATPKRLAKSRLRVVERGQEIWRWDELGFPADR